MTIRDEIDALPDIPKRLDWASGGSYTAVALEPRLALAERLLRAIDAACDHGVSSAVFEIACNNARLYLAKREAET